MLQRKLSVMFSVAAVLAASPALSHADTVPMQTIKLAGSQSSVAGAADFFTGNVRVDPLYGANDQINASGAYVTFEPGARTAWHTHPAGQYLVVVSGVGLTQEWGQAVREIRPGDVVWCPPGVKHWHGAAPATAMTHIATTGIKDGKSVQWLEQVSDEQYQAVQKVGQR